VPSSIWGAISYVSSGFTLCAFIVAAAAWYLKNRDREARLRIEAAPPEKRPELIEKTLAEVFHVDTNGLTRLQQYEIVRRQIDARIERFRIVAAVVVVLGILGTGLSALAIYRTRGLPKADDKDTLHPTLSAAPSTAGAATGSIAAPHADQSRDEDRSHPTGAIKRADKNAVSDSSLGYWVGTWTSVMTGQSAPGASYQNSYQFTLLVVITEDAQRRLSGECREDSIQTDSRNRATNIHWDYGLSFQQPTDSQTLPYTTTTPNNSCSGFCSSDLLHSLERGKSIRSEYFVRVDGKTMIRIVNVNGDRTTFTKVASQ
jgi:hypothetical protein